MAANRIGDDIQDQIIEMALEADATNLSPRELALRFTDEKRYFVSESTVYRLLKAHDLITSPAFVVIKAADQFHTKTTRPNEMWQTDFTYFKIIGWGWMYLSTVLDDFSRYIIAWKLCTNMRADHLAEVIDRHLHAVERAVHRHVLEPLHAQRERGLPGLAKLLPLGVAAQQVGALRRHVYRVSGGADRAGIGQRLDEAALALGRPAVVACGPARDRGELGQGAAAPAFEVVGAGGLDHRRGLREMGRNRRPCLETHRVGQRE